MYYIYLMGIDFWIYKPVHAKYFSLLILCILERERGGERKDQPVDVFGISDV